MGDQGSIARNIGGQLSRVVGQAVDGDGFEVFCCLLWGRLGFQSTVTPKRGGDGGIDRVALKVREWKLLQGKGSKASEVAWDAIEEVTADAAKYQARFRGTRFRRLAVTNQSFTAGARDKLTPTM